MDVSLDESIYICGDYVTLKEDKSKLCLKNETNAKEKYTILKNIQDFENKLKDPQKRFEKAE